MALSVSGKQIEQKNILHNLISETRQNRTKTLQNKEQTL